MFFHILNHLLNVSQVCFEMVGYSLGSFVGTSSRPAFPTCKDASLLLIFSYNKFCMRFSLDTSPHAHFYGKSGRGGGVVGFACVFLSLPHPSWPFYGETGGEKLFQFQHAPSAVALVQWSKPCCLALRNALALFPTP